MVERIPYDEFAYFADNASEFDIPYDGPPVVRRERVEVAPDNALSALVWGAADPELVLLHGGAQNAHTWDTVALSLDRPLVAIDLPGHGHSDAGGSVESGVAGAADDVAVAVDALAPTARTVVGMSLGGLTAIALADGHPEAVRSLVLVDVTPGVNDEKAKAITAFIDGPESFPSFEELLERTMQFNPTRSEASLRRGILHNAVQREDGSWVWRYARHRQQSQPRGDVRSRLPDLAALWDALGRVEVPLMLVRGMRAQSVVSDADEAELLRRCPHARVEHVADAGHSVQGDTPVELARLLESFLAELG